MDRLGANGVVPLAANIVAPLSANELAPYWCQSTVFNESTDTPENAAQGLPDLTGIDGEIAEETLGENGFTKKPTSTAGGYQEWKHKDGSRVFVRPNGEVIRQGPNRPRRGHPNARWVRDRYGPNGEHIPHDPGNETHNTGEIINI